MSLKKFIAVAAFTMICAATLQSQEVCRIGTFDGSSAELAGGVPDKPVTCVIGRDEPGKSWFPFAPTFFLSEKRTPGTLPAPFSLKSKKMLPVEIHPDEILTIRIEGKSSL